MIKIFPPDATSFSTNGLGVISDALTCVVDQALNGQIELKMTYPVTGRRFDALVPRGIVVAPPDEKSDPQPFRIYKITKPLSGIITVFARHLAYDLQGIVLHPFSAATLSLALQGLKANASIPCPFIFSSSRSVSAAFSVDRPYSIWQVLSGQRGSLLDVYGGEFEFDGYDVKLHSRRGSDRGVQIAYGKNLTSYSQEENISAVYTGVYPYWASEDLLVTLPEHIVNASGTYDFERILSLDLSDEFDEAPSVDQLRQRAEDYIAANDIGVPKVSWTLGFTELTDVGVDNHIYLGDTVHVVFPRYSVTASARVVSTSWDCLLGRYAKITLGSVKANLAKTVAAQAKAIERLPSVTMVEAISTALSKIFMGVDGGAIRMLDINGDGWPEEFYVADNPNPAQAVKVWRFNYLGWAASKNGYDGPFIMGATLEDGILAEAVTAANLIAGTIQSADGDSFYLNLDTGELRMKALEDVSSEISSSASEIRATLSANYYTKPETDDMVGYINDAIDETEERMSASISATADGLRSEVADSYYTKSQTDEQISDSAADLTTQYKTAIDQSATSIQSTVSANYYNKSQTDSKVNNLQTQITQNADSVEVRFSGVADDIDALATETSEEFAERDKYIKLVNGTVIVGQDGNSQDFRVGQSRVGYYSDGVATTYWESGKMMMPSDNVIPVGGSLTMGKFKWAPRSSGNLSLIYVG